MDDEDDYGGYDYDFVETVPENLICEIVCGKPLRDPHLTSCCGQHICESCLNNWLESNNWRQCCPHCRQGGKNFQHFLDKQINRKIRALQIQCTNKEKGCEWVGELGSLTEHLHKCEVDCPNKCLTDNCITRVKRKDLDDHLRNRCCLRQYECEHCSVWDTYQNITGDGHDKPSHYSTVCPEFPLECPNKCGMKNIKRKDMEEHHSICPEEIVECPNRCGSYKNWKVKKIRRKDVDDHLHDECDHRPCEHCGWKPVYLLMLLSILRGHNYLTSHYSQCPDYPLKCPNKCGEINIKRKDMASHRSKCPEETVECPYDGNHKMRRKYLKDHLRNKCERRPCEHCGWKQSKTLAFFIGYDCITDHYAVCPEFPLKCVNYCGEENIKRKNMNDHCRLCPEEWVECPNRCVSRFWEGWHHNYGLYMARTIKQMRRKDVEKHLHEECERRPCEHCGWKRSHLTKIMDLFVTGYDPITVHYTKCVEFPLECPNKCGEVNIKRKDMKDHRRECALEVVRCPFEEAGCEFTVVRHRLDCHLATTQQQHLLLVMRDNQKMKQELKKIKAKFWFGI